MKQAEKRKFSVYVSIRVKMLVAFTGLFALIFGVAFAWFYSFGSQLALDNVANQLKSTAESIANNINGDDYQALALVQIDPAQMDKTQPYWGIDDPHYHQLVDTLALYKRIGGTVTDSSGKPIQRLSVYTYVVTDTPGVVQYIGSASAVTTPPGGAKFHEVYKTKALDPAHPTDNNFMWQGLSQTMVNVTRAVPDQYGTWYSGFAPIHNSKGDMVGAVGVDLRDTTVVALQTQIRNAVVPAFLIAFVTLFILVYLISYGISRPIAIVTRRAKRVAEGDYRDEKIRWGLKTVIGSLRDETAVLNDVFGIMVEKVRQREEILISQVQELKIEIDQAKKDKQVGEIVESEFFRELQTKARTMRGRGHTPIQPAAASIGEAADSKIDTKIDDRAAIDLKNGDKTPADAKIDTKPDGQSGTTSLTSATSPQPQKDNSV